MKKPWMLCLVGLLTVAGLSWPQAPTNGATEKALVAFEERWVKAQNTNNPDLLAPLLAENFVNTSNDGKVTGKAETVADVKVVIKNSAAISDVKVSVSGVTAIATGRWTGKVTDESGKPLDLDERFTDTWVKMPTGKWLCLASHQSLIKI